RRRGRRRHGLTLSGRRAASRRTAGAASLSKEGARHGGRSLDASVRSAGGRPARAFGLRSPGARPHHRDAGPAAPLWRILVPHPSFMPAPVRYRFAYRPRPLPWAPPCALLALASAARAQSGALDPTFGTGGIVKTPVGTLADVGRAFAIQADDRIVVAGYSTTNATGDDFSVARYLLNGTLDSSFNGTGKVITPVGPTNAIDRAFAVAGFSRNGGNEDFALVRYLPDGTLDGDFGSGGIVTTAIGTVNDEALAVAIQSDGRIVAAGYSHNGANRDLALARYLPDGTLDTTFSGDGKVSVPIGTGGNAGDDEARAIAIQPDGKIVIAGLSAFGSSED